MKILPRYYRQQLAREDTRNIDRILNESAPAEQPKTLPKATLPGDERRLRGIPVIGKSVPGAIPGTIPHVHGV